MFIAHDGQYIGVSPQNATGFYPSQLSVSTSKERHVTVNAQILEQLTRIADLLEDANALTRGAIIREYTELLNSRSPHDLTPAMEVIELANPDLAPDLRALYDAHPSYGQAA